jgi:hypothetical protein
MQHGAATVLLQARVEMGNEGRMKADESITDSSDVFSRDFNHLQLPLPPSLGKVRLDLS